MRIALFHATLPEDGRKLGGVEVAVHRLAAELAKRPGDAVTVYSVSPAPEGAPYAHRRLGGRRAWLGGKAGRLTLLPAFLNLVDFSDHDVLHLHGDDWFFLRRRLPTVRTLHGSALREAQFATSLRRRLAQRSLFPLERLSARLADLPIAVGRDAVGIYGIPTVVDNGVDLELFHPGPKTPHPTVLFVGTWAGRKRGNFLEAVFAEEVRPRVPDAELVMVADREGGGGGVTHIPQPGDQELAELYRTCWVFAYPSRYEGFGIPYLEALASGTAIVTSPNDGASHLLGGGEYGVVSDDAGFGTEVVGLLLDPARRAGLAERGRRRAETFSWAAVAARHRRLYELAVEAARR